MARPRKDAPIPEMSPGQAAYVLERLIRDRRVSRTEVSQYMVEMNREISELETRLQRLRAASGNVAAVAAGMAAAAGGAALVRRARRGRPRKADAATATPRRGRKSGRIKAAITPEQLESRRLQGRYLALVRQFAAGKRAQFAKTAKEKGREAAIREMQDALKK
jgi:hypothetical protein